MRIEIQRNETSQPIVYEAALNGYTKGALYCVLVEKNGLPQVHKYPLCSIFRVIEGYEGSKRDNQDQRARLLKGAAEELLHNRSDGYIHHEDRVMLAEALGEELQDGV